MKKFKGLAWNSTDLFASKNAAIQIFNGFGLGTVKDLESRGFFGNLWVDSVIDELQK